MADCSSGEEDPKWKAAINSIATTTVKNEMVENTLDFVKDPVNIPEVEETEKECGVRLFKWCSTGIVFDHMSLKDPKKKPNLRPGRGINRSSKEFKKGIKSIAVDGSDVLSAAMEAAKRASSRLEVNYMVSSHLPVFILGI
ncbi:unnamed protein product [Brassica oleracea var. botrytis]|uniref:Uncharacterized protein n=2 Tax=Brassica TaxID=3705 RepID=A0A0D3DRQ8_BRAOL|nr:unnamed protein product [Brassica napus]CDY17738.1 BnaC08g21460D [Brassica napus]